MKNFKLAVVEQALFDEDAVTLENINRVLKDQISPISKTSDLSAEQWFNLAHLLLRYDVRLYRHALQIGIDMAQEAAPLGAYWR